MAQGMMCMSKGIVCSKFISYVHPLSTYAVIAETMHDINWAKTVLVLKFEAQNLEGKQHSAYRRLEDAGNTCPGAATEEPPKQSKSRDLHLSSKRGRRLRDLLSVRSLTLYAQRR